jgi:hypothetical protein
VLLTVRRSGVEETTTPLLAGRAWRKKAARDAPSSGARAFRDATGRRRATRHTTSAVGRRPSAVVRRRPGKLGESSEGDVALLASDDWRRVATRTRGCWVRIRKEGNEHDYDSLSKLLPTKACCYYSTEASKLL